MNSQYKINIAFAGGSCTGKSTLAAVLFSQLKIKEYDYDLVLEPHRKLKNEFGDYRSPFERFYMWRLQEREEINSRALHGFVTDHALFSFYISAKMYATEPRDQLAVSELFSMAITSLEKYQLIILAKNPEEILYKKDQVRNGGSKSRLRRHDLTKSFLEHFCPEKTYLVEGSLENRLGQILQQLDKMRKTNPWI